MVLAVALVLVSAIGSDSPHLWLRKNGTLCLTWLLRLNHVEDLGVLMHRIRCWWWKKWIRSIECPLFWERSKRITIRFGIESAQVEEVLKKEEALATVGLSAVGGRGEGNARADKRIPASRGEHKPLARWFILNLTSSGSTWWTTATGPLP